MKVWRRRMYAHISMQRTKDELFPYVLTVAQDWGASSTIFLTEDDKRRLVEYLLDLKCTSFQIMARREVDVLADDDEETAE